ncbi:MAG: deaminase [Candidatus Colwellbacteria bacterium]|nr:deaminase [Candidatus Colwellbacteria bacterium]
MTITASYIPVIHRGYVDFLKEASKKSSELIIFDDETMGIFDFYRKEIRALPAKDVADIIRSLDIFPSVRTGGLEDLKGYDGEFIMPDDEISRRIANLIGADGRVEFFPVFLRWNSDKVTKPEEVIADGEVLSSGFIGKLAMMKAEEVSKQSSDWWRRVGAALIINDEVKLFACNSHVPSEYMPYTFGDPRMFFKKGINIELSTPIHAEAAIIARAAKYGIKLDGADLYVTTFPCPPCAKLIAYSGIRTVYFKEGYSMLDAYSILKSQRVMVYRIK